MTRNRLIARAVAVSIALAVVQAPAAAQEQLHGSGHDDGRPQLHGNGRWKECSIQLDPSLTQRAWRQFTKEAGLVAYFRPLVDAEPLGRGRFEVSAVQWETAIDDDLIDTVAAGDVEQARARLRAALGLEESTQ